MGTIVYNKGVPKGNGKEVHIMAYGVYFREKGTKAYARVGEWVTPTRKAKFTCNGKIHRDLRCETLEEAQAVEKRYLDRGYEVKIKEVK